MKEYSGLDIELCYQMSQRADVVNELLEQKVKQEIIEKAIQEDRAWIKRCCEAEEYDPQIYLNLYDRSVKTQ